MEPDGLTEDGFFGRLELQERIRELLRDSSIRIEDLRQVGKTSVIKHRESP